VRGDVRRPRAVALFEAKGFRRALADRANSVGRSRRHHAIEDVTQVVEQPMMPPPMTTTSA
jgi:hypothetical protein